MAQRRRKMVYVDVYDLAVRREDACFRFARECSPVFTLYTHGLHESPAKIAATASWTRVFITDDEPPEVSWTGPSWEEPKDGFGFPDGGRVGPDPTVLATPAPDRPRAYLDWLHGLMSGLADIRGWDHEPLEYARQYCLDRGLRAYFESKPKSSPDRKYRAVLSLLIDHDGSRTLRLDVSDKTGHPIATSEQVLRPFHISFYDWRTLRSQLRWCDRRTVTADDSHRLFGAGLYSITATLPPPAGWV